MIPTVSIRDALTDPALLGSILAGESWQAWRVLLIAGMGEALTDKERGIFTKLTGRESEPLQRVEELCAVAGNSQRLSARPLDHIRPTHYRELALRPARRFV
jgi:hypothetical protein